MTLKFHCSVSDGASPAVIERSIGFRVAEQRVLFIFYLLFFFSPFLSPLQRDNTGLSYNYSCYEKDTGAKKIVI